MAAIHASAAIEQCCARLWAPALPTHALPLHRAGGIPSGSLSTTSRRRIVRGIGGRLGWGRTRHEVRRRGLQGGAERHRESRRRLGLRVRFAWPTRLGPGCRCLGRFGVAHAWCVRGSCGSRCLRTLPACLVGRCARHRRRSAFRGRTWRARRPTVRGQAWCWRRSAFGGRSRLGGLARRGRRPMVACRVRAPVSRPGFGRLRSRFAAPLAAVRAPVGPGLLCSRPTGRPGPAGGH